MEKFKSTGNPSTEEFACSKRPNLMKLFCLAGIIVSLFYSACDFRKVEAQTETTSKKESNMESIQSATPIQQNIPPIDAIAVPGIETATFALG